MEEKIKCKRCGKCCFYYDFDVKEWAPCRFLRYNDINGKKQAHCLVYRIRIGMRMNRKKPYVICGHRKDGYNYVGCPYNELYPNKTIAF